MVDENCLNRLSSDLYVYTMEVPAKHNPSVSKEVNKLNKILVKINLSPLSYLGHSTKKPVNTSFLWVFMGTNRIVIEKLLFFDHNPYLFFSPSAFFRFTCFILHAKEYILLARVHGHDMCV